MDQWDPLGIWFRYIKWVEDTYPQDNESRLVEVLEKCLEDVRDCVQYKCDSRLLDVYLRYLNLTDNVDYDDSVEWFQMLYDDGYFHQLARFYIKWADKLEESMDFEEATQIYQLASQNGAEPHNKLEECFNRFQDRVASSSGQTGRDLELVSGDRRVTIGSGSSLLRSRDNTLLPTSTFQSDKKITDENDPATSLIPAKTATQSAPKVGNVRQASKGNEALVFIDSVVVPTHSKFQVYIDEEAPIRHIVQTLPEAENPSVRLMCDLQLIDGANGELSFEEIRHRRYQRKMAANNEAVHSESAAEQVTVPVQNQSRPDIDPRQHQKPNEHLHCNVKEMYTAGGKEASFEQLRARAHLHKVERGPKETVSEASAPNVGELRTRAGRVSRPVRGWESTVEPFQ